ncbi:hypothetical protein CPJCM30710_14800 [Clostridium polyendosporum]|uniref:DUF434 domain-containing protein n=1 Tax=Clostridium polyendosporum TaxID=69208 RepID=A0A919VE68_9CLOT|nr:DUF434 domain-containing protein [Clostridium polyendosporum]GIM28814.1 hypothetical protein CPJCM30710_14800 [Clostridium polyendosporum]
MSFDEKYFLNNKIGSQIDEVWKLEEQKNEDKCNCEISTRRVARRGFNIEDDKWFSEESVSKMQIAQEEIEWLLNRGYNVNAVMDLVGGKYQFSARQRDALKRSTSIKDKYEKRNLTLLPYLAVKDGIIYIDGFNLIITLEVALSGGTLILGNDGTIRDLAGLRGTYRLIDKTDKSLELIGKMFNELKAPHVRFFLDAPVSNSGRLKTRILQHGECWNFATEVELVPNADPILAKMERVVTTDSIILDECISWFNISRKIINDYIKDAKIVNLSVKKDN